VSKTGDSRNWLVTLSCLRVFRTRMGHLCCRVRLLSVTAILVCATGLSCSTSTSAVKSPPGCVLGHDYRGMGYIDLATGEHDSLLAPGSPGRRIIGRLDPDTAAFDVSSSTLYYIESEGKAVMSWSSGKAKARKVCDIPGEGWGRRRVKMFLSRDRRALLFVLAHVSAREGDADALLRCDLPSGRLQEEFRGRWIVSLRPTWADDKRLLIVGYRKAGDRKARWIWSIEELDFITHKKRVVMSFAPTSCVSFSGDRTKLLLFDRASRSYVIRSFPGGQILKVIKDSSLPGDSPAEACFAGNELIVFSRGYKPSLWRMPPGLPTSAGTFLYDTRNGKIRRVSRHEVGWMQYSATIPSW